MSINLKHDIEIRVNAKNVLDNFNASVIWTHYKYELMSYVIDCIEKDSNWRDEFFFSIGNNDAKSLIAKFMNDDIRCLKLEIDELEEEVKSLWEKREEALEISPDATPSRPIQGDRGPSCAGDENI